MVIPLACMGGSDETYMDEETQLKRLILADPARARRVFTDVATEKDDAVYVSKELLEEVKDPLLKQSVVETKPVTVAPVVTRVAEPRLELYSLGLAMANFEADVKDMARGLYALLYKHRARVFVMLSVSILLTWFLFTTVHTVPLSFVAYGYAAPLEGHVAVGVPAAAALRCHHRTTGQPFYYGFWVDTVVEYNVPYSTNRTDDGYANPVMLCLARTSTSLLPHNFGSDIDYYYVTTGNTVEFADYQNGKIQYVHAAHRTVQATCSTLCVTPFLCLFTALVAGLTFYLAPTTRQCILSQEYWNKLIFDDLCHKVLGLVTLLFYNYMRNSHMDNPLCDTLVSLTNVVIFGWWCIMVIMVPLWTDIMESKPHP